MRLNYAAISLAGFLFSCGGDTGVLVDIGQWPDSAINLRVEGKLAGAAAVAPLSFPAPTTRFVVYLPPGQSGSLELALTAFDRDQCIRAAATTHVEVGTGIRRIVETQVPFPPLSPRSCPAPELEQIAPTTASTAGGTELQVRGKYFLPGATLQIGGLAAGKPQVLSSTEMTATLPMNVGAFGWVPTVLQNPDLQQASRSDLFSYYASQFSFRSQRELGADHYTRDVAVGDFNSDGNLDLVTSNGQSSVSVLLADGLGGFATHVDIPTGPNATAIAVGDYNEDQKLDLAVVTYGSNSVELRLGDGRGGFSFLNSLGGVSGPGSLQLVDVNGDSGLDLVVARNVDHTVQVFLGNHRGGFLSAGIFPAGMNPIGVGSGDWNRDGRVDLVVLNPLEGGLTLLLGNGQGSFAATTTYPTGNIAADVAVADVNRDGISDLVVANTGGDNVSVLLGDGRGEFAAAVNYPACGYPYALVVADFDGDQILDVATAAAGANRACVLLGDGRGGFAIAAQLPTGGNPRSIAVADLDKDGKPDLVTANYVGESVSVLLNDSK